MEKRKGKFSIVHDDRLCKRCGICVAFCPRECLSLDEMGRIVIINDKRCTGCRLCEIRCPEMAIEVIEKGKVDK